MNSIWPPSAANLAASRRLWPDPFLAPDVPPREQLERFLADPETFDDDFSEQIAASIEALRALQHLRSRTASHLPLPSVPDDEISATADPRNCQPGEIWLSNTEVEFWNGRKTVKRRIFDLPEFLILSKPIPTKNDEIVLAAPVTDAAVWPEECRSEDDVVLVVEEIGEFVAHLDSQVNSPSASRNSAIGFLLSLTMIGGECAKLFIRRVLGDRDMSPPFRPSP